MKIMVLGATGMLGSAVTRVAADRHDYEVVAAARNAEPLKAKLPSAKLQFAEGLDVENFESLSAVFSSHRPDVVINCVGIVKQLASSSDIMTAVPINTLLPHRLKRLCELLGSRLVHISTDCVFSGRTGNYNESDISDARDLYGVSKFWGEVGGQHAVTLRTSIIGPELRSAHGLLGWFLAQEGPVRGFKRAIFSGLPTNELARIIFDHVIPNPDLQGLYHVSAAPIDKDSLLRLFAKHYARANIITSDEALVIDRSLDSSRFRTASGYHPPDWDQLIGEMFTFDQGY